MALAGLVVDSPWWAILTMGFAFGAAWVNVARAQVARRAWPTMAKVLDWQRVDKLLEEDREGHVP
jgi:hypothetical protein